MSAFTPIQQRPLLGGTQKLYRFDNGYGASVVRHLGPYGGDQGLWELAVLKFDADAWDLTYTTEITDDVMGRLSEDEVEQLLRRISSLTAEGREVTA